MLNRRLTLSTKLHCTVWRNNESHTKKAKKSDFWFKQLTRECIKDLNNGMKTHCFNQEQTEYIVGKLKGKYELTVKKDNDFDVYFIERIKVIRK